MSVEIEWDPAKSASNVEKHGVTFEEALSVFRDPLARTFTDPDHSEDEDREIVIGHSLEQRLLVMLYPTDGTDSIDYRPPCHQARAPGL